MSSLASYSFCVMCMHNFKYVDSVCSIRCGHIFHENCIQTLRITIECKIVMKLFLNFDGNKMEGIKQWLIQLQKIEKSIIQLREQRTVIKI
uniref:RING-type domain-containing protein n=1 Tax=Glossina palpalis gambiensis TaxID=67801 RepID=A0A1B0ANI7_9MUSC